ncbi:hypothetical protein DMC47_14275 [Nostoc sp. 3335mG]|nr:hypothetical protein DMC47_14275 [Nostoc sp. 3335mG]
MNPPVPSMSDDGRLAGRPSIALLGTGGSSGRTLTAIEAQLRALRPDVDILFIDTQPFNLRTGGVTRYDGQGEIRRASPADCGLRRWTGSQTLNLLLNGGPIAYARIERLMRRLLGRRHDAVVMCHDRIYAETALIRAARRLGTPTVLVQEGPFCAIGHAGRQSGSLAVKSALAPLVTRSGLLPAIPDYGCAGHDLILAASDDYRRQWIAAGVPADRILVAGVPRYDPLAALRDRFRVMPRREGPARILYLVQPFAAHGKVDRQAAEQLQRVLAEGLNLAAETTQFEFIIRAHPRSGSDDVATLRRLLKLAPTDDPGTVPLEERLADIDIVMGHYSSGLLEAATLGRPVLCLPVPEAAFSEESEARKQAWLVEAGATVVTNANQIATMVKQSSNYPGIQIAWSNVERETGRVDGRASLRCAEAILSTAVGVAFEWSPYGRLMR